MPKSKKREVESDSDSDSGPEDRGPAKKKLASSSAKDSSKNDEEEQGFPLGKNKFVKVRAFKGTVYIDIREYYEKDGELKPGKKGIAMSAQQYQKFKELIPDVDEALSNM